MTNETAEKIRLYFKREFGVEYSLLVVKSMTPITCKTTDDEIYSLVDDDGMFIARVQARTGKIWVYEKQMPMFNV